MKEFANHGSWGRRVHGRAKNATSEKTMARAKSGGTDGNRESEGMHEERVSERIANSLSCQSVSECESES